MVHGKHFPCQMNFPTLEDLMALKEKQGSTISLALPALNEEETVGKVIHDHQESIDGRCPLAG